MTAEAISDRRVRRLGIFVLTALGWVSVLRSEWFGVRDWGKVSWHIDSRLFAIRPSRGCSAGQQASTTRAAIELSLQYRERASSHRRHIG